MRAWSQACLLPVIVAACLLPASCSPNGRGADEAGPVGPLEGLAEPAMEFRPWVRWWWPGGDVEDGELGRELGLLAAQGFGGAEVQAFDAALNPNAPPDELARRRSFGSAQYCDHLVHALSEAAALGLGIDLTLGSGWPSGGMHVTAEESLQTLLWAERSVQGPGIRILDMGKPDMPIFYKIAGLAESLLGEKLARYEGRHARLIAVLAGRVIGGARSSNPLCLTDHIDLDPRSVRVLTDSVDEDGVLTWDVPRGAWQVIAVFNAPDGEYPILNAQQEPGYVADHLDSGRVAAHLERLLGPETGTEPFRGTALRGVFNDSLELKVERLTSSDFLQAFQERRGYDLAPWLPAVLVPAADNSMVDTVSLRRGPEFLLSSEDPRIRYDYDRTVSDLFIERFLKNSTQWVAGRGMLFRGQSYGLNIDLVAAAGAVDIPEAEQLYAGGSEMFLKMVSSGALLYYRPVVSAEAMVWMGRPYMTTPLKIKAAADRLFACGINHIVFHGMPYRMNHDYGDTGWYPFASPYGGTSIYSCNFSEASPFWPYQARINRYLARCQYAMRQGEPVADVLLYYPWLGFPTTLAAVSGHKEFLFNGRLGDLEPDLGLDRLLNTAIRLGISETDPRAAWLEARWPLIQDLEARGFTWAWVNDESLAEAAVGPAGGIRIRGRAFEGVIVADAPWMRPEAAGRLADMASAGAAVVFAGKGPSRQPGFHDLEAGDAAVVEAVNRVARSGRGRRVDEQSGVLATLESLGVAPDLRLLTGGEAVRYGGRRLSGDVRAFFVQNASLDPVVATMKPGEDVGCEQALWLDLWQETRSVLDAGAQGALAVSLPACGSGLLLCGMPAVLDRVATGFADAPAEDAPGRVVDLVHWTLDVSGEDVAGGQVRLALDTLPDWRDIEALRFSSSPGVYRCEAALSGADLGSAGRAMLDVGWVHGAAEVTVNGRPAGVLLAPPFRLDVRPLLTEGANTIEIRVIPALWNRLVGYSLKGNPLYAEFPGKEGKLLPGGISGPVSLRLHQPR